MTDPKIYVPAPAQGRPDLPADAELWTFLLNTGDIYEAEHGLFGVVPGGLDAEEVQKALLDFYREQDWISREAYEGVKDGLIEEGYYIEVVGPYQQVPTTKDPALPATSPRRPVDPDLETVNRHRAGLGMPPIDPAAGWTTEEIREMAETIRTTGRMKNRRGELKQRLMR